MVIIYIIVKGRGVLIKGVSLWRDQLLIFSPIYMR